METPLKYKVFSENQIGRVKVTEPGKSGLIELFSYGCYSWLVDALRDKKAWEQERLETIKKEITNLKEEEARLLGY